MNKHIEPTSSLPKEIGQMLLGFNAKCSDLASTHVELTNEARKIGMAIQQWCGHRQITLSFFENHKSELPARVTFEQVRTFVFISNKLPKPALSLADARTVWQEDFVAAGLLEMPKRLAKQTPTNQTHYGEFLSRLGKLRSELHDWLRDEPFDEWTEEARAVVKQQLTPLVQFHSQL